MKFNQKTVLLAISLAVIGASLDAAAKRGRDSNSGSSSDEEETQQSVVTNAQLGQAVREARLRQRTAAVPPVAAVALAPASVAVEVANNAPPAAGAGAAPAEDAEIHAVAPLAEIASLAPGRSEAEILWGQIGSYLDIRSLARLSQATKAQSTLLSDHLDSMKQEITLPTGFVLSNNAIVILTKEIYKQLFPRDYVTKKYIPTLSLAIKAFRTAHEMNNIPVMAEFEQLANTFFTLNLFDNHYDTRTIIEEQLAVGADVNAVLPAGRWAGASLLRLACMGQNLTMVNTLLVRGAEVTFTEFVMNQECGNYAIMTLLLQYNPALVHSVYPMGFSPLTYTCWARRNGGPSEQDNKEDEAMVRFLLAHGASATTPDTAGREPRLFERPGIRAILEAHIAAQAALAPVAVPAPAEDVEAEPAA